MSGLPSPYLSLLVFHLANAQRRQAGLDTLSWNDTLAAVAVVHAQNMAEEGYVGHISPTYGNLERRLERFHIQIKGFVFGENINFRELANPIGDEVADSAFACWMESEPHRRNILNPVFEETGVGVWCVKGKGYRVFLVQIFRGRDRSLDLELRYRMLLRRVW